MEDKVPQQPVTPIPPVQSVPEPQSVPASPPPEKKSFPKALIFIVIIFMIFVGGATTYVAFFNEAKPKPVAKVEPTKAPTPTPGPTADWKIYEDPTNGFSLKYPSDWRIVEEESNLTFSETKSTEGEKPALVAVRIFETAELGPNPYGNYTPFDYKEFVRDDKTFVLMATTFQIGESASKETEKLAIETLAKMAPTFKFTESITATPSSAPTP